ncbi:hypothetical protein OGATHE_003965 [Ogataea polymorpha]|uniref:Uncharacterized protein n=1 Tax=Ogataea polymorpha TaxID=460523 RepID=A0A9P8T4J8_9ASCO|nr:hypothetical protein OGATHE_003965 [Ogataea polymorpha]
MNELAERNAAVLASLYDAISLKFMVERERVSLPGLGCGRGCVVARSSGGCMSFCWSSASTLSSSISSGMSCTFCKNSGLMKSFDAARWSMWYTSCVSCLSVCRSDNLPPNFFFISTDGDTKYDSPDSPVLSRGSSPSSSSFSSTAGRPGVRNGVCNGEPCWLCCICNCRSVSRCDSETDVVSDRCFLCLVILGDKNAGGV